MKIAILSMYSGSVSRGVETWVAEMSTRFQTDGYEVVVLSNKKNKSVLEFTLTSLPQLVNFHPDIVLPTNGGFQSLIVKLLSLLFGWKVVITGHAGIGRDDKWNILMRPNCFVSPSTRGEKWAKGLWFSKGLKTTHIPHGVDLQRFNPKVKKLKLNLKRPIYLCVASNDSYKRVDLAKSAVAKLKKGSLLVLGHELKVSQKDIPSYFAAADVFTLPSSSSEAFGIVYLEALASGLPVVATNDSLREEIVGKAGILVDPTNIKEYSEALQKAADTNWGYLPRQQAEKFSWDKVAKQYEDLFQSLI